MTPAAIVQKLWNYCNNLPEPATIARDIIADLESALEQLKLIAEDFGEVN